METRQSHVHRTTRLRIGILAFLVFAAWMSIGFFFQSIVVLVIGIFAWVPGWTIAVHRALRTCRCPQCGALLSQNPNRARDNHFQYVCPACRIKWISPARWYESAPGGAG